MKEKIIKHIYDITGWRHFSLAASLVLICSFMIGFHWRDMVSHTLCSLDSGEHCLREWIAATGGWIAVIFAYLTIKTMTRQTEDANRHQRENLELHLLERISAAERISDGAKIGAGQCEVFRNYLREALEKAQYDPYLPMLYHGTVFSRIDERDYKSLNFEGPKTDLFAVKSQVDNWLGNYSTAIKANDGVSATDSLKQMLFFLEMVETAFLDARKAADRFLEKWRPRIR
ncbi:hypothetical protein [Rhizobium skierniewicense]|uniref:hypothetical protein n=1 Tax=Rhizobium skierniewicense TaxID=984260 RepID=UPI00157398DE|nr:hypothetical protein [Rhizobium skierniewicense]NTF32321.1 hypothetical protein [Rhizobium skierniewicense]